MQPDALLALKVMRWALANGWRVQGRDMTIDGYTRWTTWEHDDKADLTLTYYRHDGHMQYDLCDVPLLSVRESVDVFVAFGLLPVEFSSAFQAGRESAYTTDHWRVVAVDPYTQTRVANANARSEREARALLKVALGFDPDARLEHRRTGATDWSRVDV